MARTSGGLAFRRAAGGAAESAEGLGTILPATTGAGALAWGNGAVASRTNQQAWGSNRALAGGGQFSRIVQYVETTNAVQTTLLTFALEEDKSYALRILLVARNTTTNSQSAVFDALPALAQRNTGGAAQLLPFNPLALTREANDAGGVAGILAELTTNGNDVLLRVTGEAAQTYEWCCCFEFVEVAG